MGSFNLTTKGYKENLVIGKDNRMEMKIGIYYLMLHKHYFEIEDEIYQSPLEIFDKSLGLSYLPVRKLPFDKLMFRFEKAKNGDIKKFANLHLKIAKGLILLDELEDAEPHLKLASHFIHTEKEIKEFSQKSQEPFEPVDDDYKILL